MARNIRWYISFKSRNGTTCRVNIYDNDWPEGVTMGLRGAADPFFYEEEDSDDLLNDVLRYRTGYIRVIEQTYGALNDIYPASTFDRYVEFLYGGVVVFNGYIQVQDFSNVLEPGPRIVEFPVISPLGLFEKRTFNPITPPTTKTLGQLLDIVLNGSTYTKVTCPDITGVGLWQTVFSLVVSPWNKDFHHSMTTSPTSQVMKPESYAYLIEGICKAFGWICHDTPQALVFTSFDHQGTYCRYAVGHIGDINYKEAESVGTSAIAVTDYYTPADDDATMDTLLPDTGIEIDYEGDLGRIDFSFERTTFVNIKTYPGFDAEDGERYSFVNLEPVPMLYEISAMSDADFDNSGHITRGPHCIAWNGHIGLLYSVFGTDTSGTEMFKIRLYVKKRTGDQWAVSFRGMSSNDGNGNYNYSIAALKEDEKVKNYYVQATTVVNDDYVEVTFKYHFSNVSGSLYPQLPEYTLLFIDDIKFEFIENGELYADYRFLPASDADTIPTTGYPKVSSSVTMPISLYRLNDHMIGETLRSTKLTEYPYLLQKRLVLNGKFLWAQSIDLFHARLWTYLSKKWRMIAQTFHPWDDEYELTMQSSGIFNVESFSVSTELEGVTSNAPGTVVSGYTLSVELTADTGTQIVASTVHVTMGGVDITSTVYNSTYNTVTIPSVTGNVSITAKAVIVFEDSAVKEICLYYWGNHTVANELTKSEAALPTSLAAAFRGYTTIMTFDELQFFAGLTSFGVSSGNGEFQGCTNLTSVKLPSITVNSIDLTGLFRGCSKLTSADLSPISTQSITAIQHIFRGNSVIKEITLPSGSYSGSATYAFASCTKLETLNISGTADWSGITSFGSGSNGAFYNCTKLENIMGTITGICQNITLANCSALTRDSLLVIINGLADLTGQTSKTLTLHADARARLTSADEAIVTGKNWTFG